MADQSTDLFQVAWVVDDLEQFFKMIADTAVDWDGAIPIRVL
jgi:hypothetical protein